MRNGVRLASVANFDDSNPSRVESISSIIRVPASNTSVSLYPCGQNVAEKLDVCASHLVSEFGDIESWQTSGCSI